MSEQQSLVESAPDETARRLAELGVPAQPGDVVEISQDPVPLVGDELDSLESLPTVDVTAGAVPTDGQGYVPGEGVA